MPNPDVPPFSIVMIARNEAHTLPGLKRTIARYHKRGVQVVLVDTGSTDETVPMARAAGFRVVRAGSRFRSKLRREQAQEINERFARNGEGPLVRAGVPMFHFARAREYASSLAANDFVLHLDASDRVQALDMDFLGGEIAGGTVRQFTFWKELVSTTRTREALSFLVSLLYDRRLWHWEGYCHEVLVPNVPPAAIPPPVKCTREQLMVRHVRDTKKSRANYLPSLALDALAEPENMRRKHYLGRELCYARYYHSAIALLEEHVRGEGWRVERAESLCLIGTCHQALGDPDAAEQDYARAFALDPTRREPLLCLAGLAQARGDFEASVRHAYAALEIPRTGAYFERDANYTYIPHSILYWSLFWLGRRAEAKKHWAQCITLCPTQKRFRADAKLFGSQV